jgi:hypothetical protein
LLLELRDAIGQLLPVLRELLSLLPEILFAFLGLALTSTALLKHAAQAIGLPLLFVRKLIGLASHLVDAAGILLALKGTEGLRGFAEAIGGPAGIGGALPEDEPFCPCCWFCASCWSCCCSCCALRRSISSCQRCSKVWPLVRR